MKIQEVKKEKLPLEFITATVGKLWDEVGILQAQMKAIKETYSGTAEVDAILQDLLDAYLICTGRLQNQINDKKYLDLPDDKDLALTEAVDLEKDEEEDEGELIPKGLDKEKPNLENVDIDVKQEDDSIKIEITPSDKDENDDEFDEEDFGETKPAEKAEAGSGEPFEYFVEFDEPEITDEDRSKFSDWVNRG